MKINFKAEPIKPTPPVTAWDCSTGLGKSHQARNMFANSIKQLRADGNKSTAIVFVPNHKLGQEQVDAFNTEYPELTARRFLGISQDDPDIEGKKMCHKHSVVSELCKNGGSMKNLCAKPRLGIYCEHHTHINTDYPKQFVSCGYSRQSKLKADVWFLPQQMLYAKAPKCVGKPALIGIDESFWQSSLKGFSPNYRFRLETLVADRGIKGRLDPMRELKYFSEEVHGDIVDMPNGFINTALFGIYEETVLKDCATAYRLEMSRLSSIKINPKMSNKMLQVELDKLKGMSVMRLANFWKLLRLAMNEGGYTPLIEKRTVEDSEGVTTWLYLYSKEAIHKDWDQPTVLLDATMPVEINKRFFPQLVHEQFTCPVQHTTTVQIIDKALSKAMMLPNDTITERKQDERERNMRRLLSLCSVLVSRVTAEILCINEPIKLLLVTTKALEEKLIEVGLPDGVATLHFGAVSGLDAYKDVPCMVIAGRLEMPLRIAEHQASVIKGSMVKKIPISEGAWYKKGLSGIETSDDIKAVPATYHPEPLVEEIRWQWNEAQIIQAIGRGRAVGRTATNPLEMFVLTNVPLPMVVDHAVNWADVIPSSIETVLAEHGVAPLSYNEMVRIKPDAWKTKRVARHAVSKFIERYSEAATSAASLGDKMPIVNTHRQNGTQMRLFKTLILIEYTRDIKSAKPCRAVIRKGHEFSSGKAALIAVVGEIRQYRVICAIQSTQPLPMPNISEPIVLQYDPENTSWVKRAKHTNEPLCGMTETGRVYISFSIVGDKPNGY